MHVTALAWTTIALGLMIAAARIVLLAFLKGKRRKELPIFSSYLVLGSFVLLLGTVGYLCTKCTQYFYIYWVMNFLYVALEFGVMYEIFVNALKPYSALIDLGKMLFLWASAFLLIVAAITAITTTGANQTRLVASAAVLERSLRLIECGLLMLFFFFEKRLGLSWRSPSVSIALGLGVYAATDLGFSYLKVQIPGQIGVIDVLYSLVFFAVLSFWGYCLLRPETERTNVLDSPNRLILQRWNEALISYSYGDGGGTMATVDSFLPNVEKTVERVMARKMTN
ncbi:MAG: hypothetical protein ACM3SW_20695 [Actinomycetota bacterium]